MNEKLVCLLVLAFLLLACGPLLCGGDVSSIVTDKKFVARHSNPVMLPKPGGGFEVTMLFVGDRWYLIIEDCCKENDWCETYRVSVSEDVYNSTDVGSNF